MVHPQQVTVTFTARTALGKAIDAAERADRLDTNNPVIPPLALLAQAWAAIAEQLRVNEWNAAHGAFSHPDVRPDDADENWVSVPAGYDEISPQGIRTICSEGFEHGKLDEGGGVGRIKGTSDVREWHESHNRYREAIRQHRNDVLALREDEESPIDERLWDVLEGGDGDDHD